MTVLFILVLITGPDKASLVSLFFNYMSVLLRKTRTIAGSSPVKFLNKLKGPSMTVLLILVRITGLEPARLRTRS